MPKYSQENIDQIVEKIRSAIHPDKIYLFGSYASDSPKENSDLDICIIKDKVSNKQEELSKAKKSLFFLGIPLDILLFDNKTFADRQNIWGSVQYEIFNKGKKLYERK